MDISYLCAIAIHYSFIIHFIIYNMDRISNASSPGKCSMIDRFLGDALGVLSCQFWSTVLPFGARLPNGYS